MKLKKWVKVTLVVIIMFLMLYLVGKFQRKEISSCVENGYSQYWCELHLN